MRVAFGTDEPTSLTRFVVEHLAAAGHQVWSVGDPAEWPEVGRLVGQRVAGGQAERGVVCCTTGTGVSIAANKVAGVRAALCTDAYTAAGARRWNDANVLALGLRLTTPALAREMLDAFFGTPADDDQIAVAARADLAAGTAT